MRELRTLLFGALTVWLVISWALVVQRVIRYYCPFPAWDYWRVMSDLDHWKALGAKVLLRPHNEHRIIFPEVIYLADVLFRGRLILPVVASLLCYLATYVALAWTIALDRDMWWTLRLFAALLAGIVLGWQGSAVVTGDPFLLQWTLSTLCAVTAIICVVKSRFTMALIAGVIATYSSGNGLVLWPILAVEAWYVRASRAQMAAVLTTGAAAIATYFVGYDSGTKLNAAGLIFHPAHALGFLLSYIGMPFGLFRWDALAITLGAINVLAVILVFTHAVRRNWLRSETAIVLFCVYAFTLLTAILTMIGRLTPSSGYGDAKASRFWVIQLVNWADVVLLCLWFSARTRSYVRNSLVIGAVLLVAIGFGTLKLRSSLAYDDDQFAKRQLATLGFENGLEDPELARKIFPSPGFVFSLLPYLRTHGLSIYSLPETKQLGKPVQTVGSISKDLRPGAITYTFAVDGGVGLAGWTEPDRHGSEEIILLNEKQQVVGFGRKLAAGFPWELRNPATPNPLAWVAFVNFRYGVQTVSAYFLRRGHLEPIGTPIPIQGE